MWAIKSDFVDSFGTFLERVLLIQNDDTYSDIVSDIEGKVQDGMDVRKAVKRVLPQYKHKFQGLFEFDADDAMYDDDEVRADSAPETEFPSRMQGYLAMRS